MEVKQNFQLGYFRPLAPTSDHDDPLKALLYVVVIELFKML